jgi:ABC-type nitrate/sulfonate/bicarbonate transport system permease component
MKRRDALSVLPWRSAISVVAILLSWLLLDWLHLANPLFLPPLHDLLAELSVLVFDQSLYRDVAITVYRATAGLCFSVIMAVPLGLVFGRNPRLYEFFEFPVDFLRSIPSSAMFFLFILFFGIGDESKIAVVVYGCALILLVGTIYGAKPNREKQDRINMLLAFGATRWQIFRLAVFWDALPHVIASIRVCVSLALVLVIVTEMFLGSTSGLGHRLYDSYLAYEISRMWCLLLILGLVGFSANRLSIWLEKKVAFWQPNN